MNDYRSLTEEEITILEDNGCTADDWSAINVSEDFVPAFIKDVTFYGNVCLGVFDKYIEIEEGFRRHSGISHATLRNVTVGDNCLIENIGNYISEYVIGEECYIVNVGTMAADYDNSYFGEDNTISVLNEDGSGNVIFFNGLSSQLAAFMVKYANDKEVMKPLRSMIHSDIMNRHQEQGFICDRVKIVNVDEISNVYINDDCEISGASRLRECTIMSIPEASVYIGNDVICDNSIISAGSSILDGAKLDNCFVGEACHIGKGFSATNSVFFANSYMDNGEACAAFCGPFSVSHHKSTLLIGGQYSFYNAGSNTNYSNHAYKMGPIHYGLLERGSKTASGAHILMPATIGSFSMCMGKIQNHPDTRMMPFSYIIGVGDSTYIVPGRNLVTVGTYRDTHKWQKRDMRPRLGRQSLIHFDWLSPFTVSEAIKGKRLLEQLKREQGENPASYNYEGCIIKNNALLNGIKYYDMLIRLYMGEAVRNHEMELPDSSVGTGDWADLAGLMLPEAEEQQLADDIREGVITEIEEVKDRFVSIYNQYEQYKWTWTYRVITDYFHLEALAAEDEERINSEYETAKRDWLHFIEYDAEKEFRMGDVEEETLNKFLASIEK
jgi:NDP-sugar pyrophosphorylase family protein